MDSKKTVKKIYESSSIILEREDGSNLYSPPLQLEKIKELNIEYKNKDDKNSKDKNIISESLKELSESQYQNVIRKLSIFLNRVKKNQSIILEEDIAIKPIRDAYLILAIAYYESGDEIHAWPILNKLTFYADKWEPIYLTLSDIYLRKKAPILARSAALRGLDKVEHPSVQMHLYYARSEIEINNLEIAKKYLESAKNIFPKNSEVIGWLGIIDLKSNNILEACIKFKKSFLLNPNNHSIVYNHAACLIKSQEYHEAQEIIKTALLNSKPNTGLYYLSGLIQNKQGKLLEAQKHWGNFLKYADRDDPRRSYVRIFMPEPSWQH